MQLLAPVQDHGSTFGARGTYTESSILPEPANAQFSGPADYGSRKGPTSALVNQWWDQGLKARERLVVVAAVVVMMVVAAVEEIR
jgi:hypothetical protein